MHSSAEMRAQVEEEEGWQCWGGGRQEVYTGPH